MNTIWIIEDDCSIGDMLEEALTKEGYAISRAYSGTEALLLLSHSRPDLVLLDLMLPGLNGEEILPKLSGIPTIIISAKADLDSKVSLLLGGAVDYVTKPFQMKELLARISVHLRLAVQTGTTSSLTFETIHLDTISQEVFVNDLPVHLTRTEYAILKLLMQHPSQVIAKSTLLDRISEDTPDCTDSSLKMHISNLRKKLREADSGSNRDYIEAVWGIGFKLRR